MVGPDLPGGVNEAVGLGQAGKLSVWGAQGLGTPAQAEATKVKEDGGGDICFGIQKKH